MPRNDQFSVLCPELIKKYQEKSKILVRKKLAKIKKCLPGKENVSNTCSPPVAITLGVLIFFIFAIYWASDFVEFLH